MIYADKSAGIIVAGATGRQGAFHIALMNEYAKTVGGAGVVAGVTPGKGGQVASGVPVYNSIREAMADIDAEVSVIFVPGSCCRRLYHGVSKCWPFPGRDHHRTHPSP